MLGGSRFGVSRWTVGNVKRLLPPRQSRGASLVRLGDLFGWALAADNFGKTVQDDLAIGAPGENEGVGAVHIIYGSATGLKAAGNQMWHGNTPGSAFGGALAAADFGRTAHGDLAIGIPFSAVDVVQAAGMVRVLFGTRTGLALANSQSFTGGAGLQAHEHFGWSLAAANFGNERHSDLAVGIPDRGAGAVLVRFGSPTGLTFRVSSGRKLAGVFSARRRMEITLVRLCRNRAGAQYCSSICK